MAKLRSLQIPYAVIGKATSRPDAHAPYLAREFPKAVRMLDILVILLGTGGILLMAAYAALCDRI
jgi:hypothetical protein